MRLRECCVQYNESDWSFVRRLVTDEGITLYLNEGGKEAERETAVLVDSNEPSTRRAAAAHVADRWKVRSECWLAKPARRSARIDSAFFAAQPAIGRTSQSRQRRLSALRMNEAYPRPRWLGVDHHPHVVLRALGPDPCDQADAEERGVSLEH